MCFFRKRNKIVAENLLEKRLQEISKKGLENAHTIDFTKEYQNSIKILEKRKIR